MKNSSMIDASSSATRKLRMVIIGLVLALVVPLGIMVSEAYQQLKRGNFFHSRSVAALLVTQIDRALNQSLEQVKKQGPLLQAALHTNKKKSRPLEFNGVAALLTQERTHIYSKESLTPKEIKSFESQCRSSKPTKHDKLLRVSERYWCLRLSSDNQQKYHLNAIVVDFPRFLQNIVRPLFRRSALGYASMISIRYNENTLLEQKPLASHHNPLKTKGAALFWKKLTGPFQDLDIIFYSLQIPRAGGSYLTGFILIVMALILPAAVIGLYWIASNHIELARQRGNFVAAVSHELRTPLSTIQMYSEMLHSNPHLSPEIQREYAGFIFSESNRLGRLVSDILDLSRVRSQPASNNFQDISLEQLFIQFKSRMQPIVSSKGFELRVETHSLELEDKGTQLQIRVDIDHMHQIMLNVIDNAIKFSKNALRKEIVVGARLISHFGSRRVIIFVRDFGPGLGRGERRKAFKLFYRAGDEHTRTTPGTGIGLALVKELAEQMDASVQLVAENPGAEFQIAFRYNFLQDSSSQKAKVKSAA